MKKLYIIILLIFFSSITFAQKHSIKKKKIENIELIIEPNALIFPGSTFEIGLIASTADSYHLTNGFLNGKINWKNYDVEVVGGKFSRGKIVVDSNLEPGKRSSIVIKINPRHHEQLFITERIPLNQLINIEAIAVGNYTKAPGSHVPVKVIGEFDNGITKELNGPDSHISKLTVDVHGGKLYKDKICINEDPYSIINHTVQVVVYSSLNPSVLDTLNIRLDYKRDYILNLYGQSGSSGWNGSDGFSGGVEQHGGDGGHGEHGNDGYHGKDVEVRVESYHAPHIGELLMVDVFELNGSKSWNYIINPIGGSLNIKSIGGDGGSGGDGGRGGSGGPGLNGEKIVKVVQVNDSTVVEEIHYTEGTRGGDGGYGGHGGDGGYGGDGGNITVIYSETVQPLLNTIKVASIPGSGGSGGFAGWGGSGGTGGTGSPNGCNGSSGNRGSDGSRGYSGERGKIQYYNTSQFSSIEKIKR